MTKPLNADHPEPKIHLVGGAVRDLMLGREPKDRDYIVVGATEEWMLAQGYRKVGADFPVFLHPETNDEYALARRERKTGRGYNGFVCEFDPSVTLEEDLSRRDLTINAMAMIGDTLVDPFNGMDDLVNGVLRHTSPAFSEDPLRVLRVARFVARYGFSVSSDTQALCRRILESGEMESLPKERIWTEFRKMFEEDHPSQGLLFLESIQAGTLSSSLSPWLSVSRAYFNVDETHDIEAKLIPIEKLFLETDIAYWTKEEACARCLPSSVWREARFFDQVYDRLFGDYVESEQKYSSIIEVFDAFREEFRNGKIDEVASLALKLDPNYPSAPFFNALKKASQSLLELNFSEAAKNKKPEEIRQIVKHAKLNEVNRAMRDLDFNGQDCSM